MAKLKLKRLVHALQARLETLERRAVLRPENDPSLDESGKPYRHAGEREEDA